MVFVWAGRIRLLWIVLIFLLTLLVIVLFIFRICYKAVKSAGERLGYNRGLEEGQKKGPDGAD